MKSKTFEYLKESEYDRFKPEDLFKEKNYNNDSQFEKIVKLISFSYKIRKKQPHLFNELFNSFHLNVEFEHLLFPYCLYIV